MNNHDALKEMCNNCQRLMAEIPTKEDKDSIEIHSCGHQMCPWRVISNDYCEEYETLKKAINDLEHLKSQYDDLVKCIKETHKCMQSKGTEYLLNFVEVQNGK